MSLEEEKIKRFQGMSCLGIHFSSKRERVQIELKLGVAIQSSLHLRSTTVSNPLEKNFHR